MGRGDREARRRERRRDGTMAAFGRLRGALLVGLLLGGCIPGRPGGEPVPVGVVLSIRGAVAADGPGRGAGEGLRLGSILQSHDRLEAAPGGEATILASSPAGRTGFYALGEGEEVRLWDLPEEEGADFIPVDPAVADALVEGARGWQVKTPEGPPRFPEEKRGEVELLAPRGRILERRPTFCLRIPDGAPKGEVDVKAIAGMGEMVLFRFDTSAREVPFPPEAMDLRLGAMVWMEAVPPDGRAPGTEIFQEFRVANRGQVKEVADFRKEIEPLRAKDPLAAAFAESISLLRLEIFHDAALALMEARRLAPDDDGLRRHLSRILADGLGLTEPGAKEFQRRFGGP